MLYDFVFKIVIVDCVVVIVYVFVVVCCFWVVCCCMYWVKRVLKLIGVKFNCGKVLWLIKFDIVLWV